MTRKWALLTALVVSVVVGCRAATAPGEVVAGGSTITGTEQLNYIHDDKRGVGCWLYAGSDGTALQCLPDTTYTVAR